MVSSGKLAKDRGGEEKKDNGGEEPRGEEEGGEERQLTWGTGCPYCLSWLSAPDSRHSKLETMPPTPLCILGWWLI